MAAGEYTSVASQSEAAEREIAKERAEIIANPEGETRELAEMYVAKGIDRDLALEVSRQIHADVDNAVTVHAREELGVDPGDLASPMLAAVSSFLAFAVVNLMEKHFGHLVDYDFTAHMEDVLDEIARGEAERVRWLQRFSLFRFPPWRRTNIRMLRCRKPKLTSPKPVKTSSRRLASFGFLTGSDN